MNNEQLSASDSSFTAQPIIHSSFNNCSLFSELEELKVGDLACGSGHILNECFDLLYDLYIAEGYGRSEAIENIFRHNLTGIDLDTRAKQLATFALLLKACQKDAAFADGHCLPRVLDMPEPVDSLDRFFGVFMHDMGPHSSTLVEAVKLCGQARDLGSIMKFDITEQDRKDLAFCVERWEQEHETHELNRNANVVAIAKLILALTEKYHALVMNPPYMGSGNMNAVLAKYVKDNYEEGKADLFSVFMLLAIDRLLPNGKYGMINMQSWMFLSSFEKLRTRLLKENRIDNMLHLGPRTFDELSGEVVQNTAFVVTKGQANVCKGAYYRLVGGRNCSDKEQLFLTHINPSQEGQKICYNNISQDDFTKIPGSPIGYWVSEKIISIFEKGLLKDHVETRQGLATGDNDRFLRLWFEIDITCFNDKTKNINSALSSIYKWFPYRKGGSARKWYGNRDYVLSFDKQSFEILSNQGNHLPSKQYYFKEAITWSLTSSGFTAFRFYPQGGIFDVNGMSMFDTDDSVLCFLNSKLCAELLRLINPTLASQKGDIDKLPYIHCNQLIFENIAQQNITISK